MNVRRLGIAILFYVALLAMVLEIFFAAPKVSQYCSQPSCLGVARDILIGKNEDYLGQLISPLFFVIGVGFTVMIISLLTKTPKRWGIFGLSIIFAGIGYGILLRFYVVFSRWPMESWFIASLILLVCGYHLFVRRERRRASPQKE